MAGTALTDFQKKKILDVFNTLYDTNKDGVIELTDFEEAIKKFCSIHKWPKDGDKYIAAKHTMSTIWDGLRGFADYDEDNKVTKDEWLKMWSSCVGDLSTDGDKGFPDWQKNYMEFMFTVNDTSGDGFIDKSEYTTLYTAFGIDKATCETTFDRLAQGTNGKISKEDFKTLWKEYFVSNDRNARGNFLFGKPPSA
ncbi:sarcoplasmic calcium-binding proteins I, III, and IV-like [Gigantopelta aegis]|uniref:sarcoplasmic calcium-binding proteins I, III, and IV-like n=1 Tax=Gigantopelta aegis TaxID=1735272 RepID=UPI001B887B5B|nr:sarcoplasmic calcium-binding proteins I, III, and IV-like [Gigantopelta aegis]